jgi:hypothetical protein
MNTERFIARDSKSALEKAKAKLGADALVLSTERIGAGIEISVISGSCGTESTAHVVKTSSSESLNEITLGYLDRELKALRNELHAALGNRSWREVANTVPVLSTVKQRLLTLGLKNQVADYVVSQVNPALELNDAWAMATSVITASLTVVEKRAAKGLPRIITGATSGFRSLITRQLISAELLDCRPKNIAVISVSDDPSGALVDYCKQKKIKYIRTHHLGDFKKYVKRFASTKLIFVETNDLSPALGINDAVLAFIKDQNIGCEVISVMSADSQSDSLEASLRHTQGLPVAGAVVSGCSEAITLGPVLDNLIMHEIPLLGVSRSGEEFMEFVEPAWLINTAKRLARSRIEANTSKLAQLNQSLRA